MKEWILLVTGIGIITVISQVLLSNKRTSAIVKRSVAILLTTVIISPIPSLIENKFNFNESVLDFEYTKDQNFIDFSHKYLINSLIKDLESKIEAQKISGYHIEIDFTSIDTEIEINNVYVYFNSQVIIDETKHNYNCNQIREIITSNVEVTADQVVFINES